MAVAGYLEGKKYGFLILLLLLSGSYLRSGSPVGIFGGRTVSTAGPLSGAGAGEGSGGGGGGCDGGSSGVM